MTESTHPIVNLTNEEAEQFLQRAPRVTLILGAIAAVAVMIGSGWRNAAMLAVEAPQSQPSASSSGSAFCESSAPNSTTRRFQKGALMVVVFFVLRLTIYAGVIYGSLKGLHGSVVPLLCGLGLAALAVMFEAVRLLAE